ncbi:MAG: alpha/beta fold hydrolase [Verrucomicrobiales bacterium]
MNSSSFHPECAALDARQRRRLGELLATRHPEVSRHCPQSLAALILPVANALPTPGEIREHLTHRVAPGMVPESIIITDHLPRLPNGKLDRKQLRVPLEEPPAEATPPSEPNSERGLTDTVATIFAHLLGKHDVAADSNFFALGGHSLLALQLAMQVEAKTGLRLPPGAVFRHPTPAQIASFLAPPRAEKTLTLTPSQGFDHLFPILTEGAAPPFFLAFPGDLRAIACGALADSGRPVIGIRGLEYRHDLNYRRWASLAELAKEVLDEVLAAQPVGPHWIGGYSFGGMVAIELARLLTARGMAPARLILFDPTAPIVYRHGCLAFQIRRARSPIRDLSPRQAMGLWLIENHPFSSILWTKLGRIFYAQPTRHLRWRLARRRITRGLPATKAMLRADYYLEAYRLFHSWQLEDYGGDTTFVRFSQSGYDSLSYWQPYLPARVKIHTVTGSHINLKPESIQGQQLAEIFREELR